MLTITNDYTRKSWVFLCKACTDLYSIFLEFKARVELETGHKLQAVRLDGAAEFRALATKLEPYGVAFEFTTAYTLEQNGVLERLNRILITIARSMLIDAKLPAKFWGDAVLTACYLRNRTPIGPKGITPEEVYSGKKPDIRHLRAYGCLAYAHIPKEHRSKL
jgi:hypothetical protein